MSQVHISNQTHTVTVNHDSTDLSYLIDKAQKLWEDTRPPAASPGPAIGFTSQINGQYNHDRQQGSQWRPVRAEAAE